MARKPSKKTRGGSADSHLGFRGGNGRAAQWLVRLLVWVLLALLAALAVAGAWLGLRRALFVANPHFTLRNIEVKTSGRLHADEVVDLLGELGAREGTNLFALDLGELRRRLENSVVVHRAQLARRLPETLEVVLLEREPAAQLLKHGGRLIDNEGWVLPECLDQDLLQLPVVTGIRGGRGLLPGMRVSDDMVAAALDFLRIVATDLAARRTFDVAMVQIDYSGSCLKVHLRAGGTFVRGAVVVLPVNGMEQAIERVEAIVAERVRGRQKTSRIDATYEVNVPVLP